MVTIQTDKRRLHAEPDEAAEARLAELAPDYLATRIEIAKLLLALDRKKTYFLSGAASIREYAARLSIPADETTRLVNVGLACEMPASAPPRPERPEAPPAPPTPSVEERIRAGEIPLENADALGKLLRKPGAVRDGEDWAGAAANWPKREFKSAVQNRIEEMRQGEPVWPFTLQITEAAKSDFARAREIASGRAGEPLSDGETFTLVVRHYVDTYAPERGGEGKRRLPDTSERPGDRFIPAQVKREIRRRAGLCCEVPGCENRTFLEFAHLEWHKDGGAREVRTLVLVCTRHHTLLDAGRIRFAGWVDGKPTFQNSRGELLTDRAAPAARPPGAESRHPAPGTPRDPTEGNVAERPPPARGAA